MCSDEDGRPLRTIAWSRLKAWWRRTVRRFRRKQPPGPSEPSATTADLAAIFRRHYTPGHVAEMADRPSPLFALLRPAATTEPTGTIDTSSGATEYRSSITWSLSPAASWPEPHATDQPHVFRGGTPTPAGLRRIDEIAKTLRAVIVGHDDNTDMRCRIDLVGHDCCETCNEAARYLMAASPEFAADIKAVRDAIRAERAA